MNDLLKWLGRLKGNPEAWAQAAHFLVGYAAVLTTAFFHGWPWLAGIIVAGAAAVIEFWFDRTYEPPSAAGNDWLDWAFYCLGAAAGLGTVYI